MVGVDGFGCGLRSSVQALNASALPLLRSQGSLRERAFGGSTPVVVCSPDPNEYK